MGVGMRTNSDGDATGRFCPRKYSYYLYIHIFIQTSESPTVNGVVSIVGTMTFDPETVRTVTFDPYSTLVEPGSTAESRTRAILVGDGVTPVATNGGTDPPAGTNTDGSLVVERVHADTAGDDREDLTDEFVVFGSAGTDAETDRYWDAGRPVWNNDGDTVIVLNSEVRRVGRLARSTAKLLGEASLPTA